ncbi:MAG: hypothetical protein HKN68_08220 [Saprospiraceae bacterium]|nr:hypothetical protein [Saprospiraceae bacterium]
MKKLFYILSAVIILPLFSCSDDPIAEAEVRFRLRYEDKPLVAFEEVSYPDGKSLYVTRVSFFIEDFTLMGEEPQTVFDLDYFTLTDDHLTAAAAMEGTMVYRGELEPRDYTTRFSIGINPTDNAKVPADFPSSNVLSNAAEYWAGWKSYVFAKVEGFIDLDGDGDEETGFALHLGGDDAYRTITTTGNISLDEDRSVMYVDIQLEKLFMNNGVMYDIAANPQIHSPEQNPIVIVLSDNLVTCFE